MHSYVTVSHPLHRIIKWQIGVYVCACWLIQSFHLPIYYAPEMAGTCYGFEAKVSAHILKKPLEIAKYWAILQFNHNTIGFVVRKICYARQSSSVFCGFFHLNSASERCIKLYRKCIYHILWQYMYVYTCINPGVYICSNLTLTHCTLHRDWNSV